MGSIKVRDLISISLLLIIALLIVQPVFADIPKSIPSSTDNISIAYRGAGGYFVGSTVVFDGRNSVGNVTVLKISGAGLPAEGVPLNDLNAQAGAGNMADVNSEGTWKFVWYTSTINGIEKLQTARYTITAMDLAKQENLVTTSVYIRKPEFSIVAQPDTLESGNYIQLTGNAENGVNTVRIDITDLSGKILQTFESEVSASGYFSNGFHANLPPGQYYVVITNPVLKKTSRATLTIIKPQPATQSPAPTLSEPVATITVPSVLVSPSVSTPAGSSALPTGSTGILAITSTPEGATVLIDGKVAGVTPVTLNAIAAGTHQVDIQAPDYQTNSLSVNVKAGETASLAPLLQKNTSPLPVYLLAIIGILLVACIVVVLLLTRRKNP